MILKLCISVLLGVLIGVERELCGKDAGIRTMSLITLGSTLFVLMSSSIVNGDNSRIIAQIVSGIGFLGAGIIWKEGSNVHGLTTAATAWCSAAVGCLCGMGIFKIAFIATVVIIIINASVRYLKKEDNSDNKNKTSQ